MWDFGWLFEMQSDWALIASHHTPKGEGNSLVSGPITMDESTTRQFYQTTSLDIGAYLNQLDNATQQTHERGLAFSSEEEEFN